MLQQSHGYRWAFTGSTDQRLYVRSFCGVCISNCPDLPVHRVTGCLRVTVSSTRVGFGAPIRPKSADALSARPSSVHLKGGVQQRVAKRWVKGGSTARRAAIRLLNKLERATTTAGLRQQLHTSCGRITCFAPASTACSLDHVSMDSWHFAASIVNSPGPATET